MCSISPLVPVGGKVTPSMYVVCSAHICQGLRGWEGAAGGLAPLREAEGRSGELESVSWCDSLQDPRCDTEA